MGRTIVITNRKGGCGKSVATATANLGVGLARPRSDGGYELLCGNRRKRACEIAELATMPVIIRELDDDSARNLDRRSRSKQTAKRTMDVDTHIHCLPKRKATISVS